MTTYRLYPSTNGPSTATSFSGNFISGVCFTTTASNCWFEGYWWWVCPNGQQFSPVKCALWSATGPTAGTLVPGSVVTSGTLTAGQWNFIPLPQPIQISIWDSLIAGIGCNGAFPFTAGGYASPVSSGVLYAFGKGTNFGGTSYVAGGQAEPYGIPNGCFSEAGSDPSVFMPDAANSDDNFWVDVQVTDVDPGLSNTTYRLWPNRAGADVATVDDDNFPYVVGTEFILTETCKVNKIWYWSRSGSPDLVSAADVWRVNSPITTNGTNLYHDGAPAWKNVSGSSASAGSGWCYVAVSSLTLPAGTYKVSIYDQTGASAGSSTSKRLGYWRSSATTVTEGLAAQSAFAPTGITSGPLSAPTTADAVNAFSYLPASGNPTEPGQSTFATGDGTSSQVTGDIYPNQYVGVNSSAGDLSQNYWVDIEVTPSSSGHSGSFFVFF